MLSAYVNASDMEGAAKFFKRLKQDGFTPNVVTYGILIKGYAKTNDLEKMMERYEEMQASGIKADQTIFTTIMDAYGKNRDFDSAIFWFKEMESRGAYPDQKAKNILLSLAKTAEEMEEAKRLVGQETLNGSKQKLNGLLTIDDDEEGDAGDDDYEEPYFSTVGKENANVFANGLVSDDNAPCNIDQGLLAEI